VKTVCKEIKRFALARQIPRRRETWRWCVLIPPNEENKWELRMMPGDTKGIRMNTEDTNQREVAKDGKKL